MPILDRLMRIVLAIAVSAATPALAVPWQFADNTRYLAMGDSLSAGYGALPATQGFAYLLYKEGAFERRNDTLFANAAVPGVTSSEVLAHQVPQALASFQPDAITLTVGGNDLLAILVGADPATVLAGYQANLTQILTELCFGMPGVAPLIVVGNLYTIDEIPGAGQVVALFNAVVDGVAGALAAGGCDVRVADVHGAFLGRTGLLLIERNGADALEVHPTNTGYRVMADAFEDAIDAQ